MRKVNGTQLLWITGAGALALAAAVGGCSSKSSGNNTTTNEDGGEEDSATGSSSGAVSSGSSSGAGSSGSSSGAGSSSSGSSGGVAEASTGSDGAVEAASSSGGTEAGAEASTGDAGCTTLNLYNFDSWCSVSIAGAAASPNGTQTVCVAPGTVSLVAEPKNGTFELGPDPWIYISGTGGTTTPISGTIVGDGGVGSTSTTSVTVGSTAGCVLVCCPFTNGTGCTASESGYTAFTANCP